VFHTAEQNPLHARVLLGIHAFCSVDALRALMTADVKCLLVNLPHNPSGWLPTQQQWQDMIDCARQVIKIMQIILNCINSSLFYSRKHSPMPYSNASKCVDASFCLQPRN
jgi:aspartate/methionine/tyrosine aminotransferase